MAAEGRLTKRWWSRWPRWRRGSRQTNAVAAKPALLRPCIMLSTASNKCKVTKLHANHVCNWFFNSCLSHYLASKQHLCLCDPAANSEYYNLLMQNGQDERRDVRVFTLEELERVTSEHTLKNTVNMHAERRRPHQLVENLSIHYLQFLGVLKYSLSFTFKCKPTCTCVFISASFLGVCVSVCVFTAFACVCDLARLCARVFVHICVCRTPLWWFSRCRAAGWCTPQSRLPVSCAARGNFWSQPSLWSCSSIKMWMCSTHTRLSCICRPGATRTQVCWNRIYLLWFISEIIYPTYLSFNLRKK